MNSQLVRQVATSFSDRVCRDIERIELEKELLISNKEKLRQTYEAEISVRDSKIARLNGIVMELNSNVRSEKSLNLSIESAMSQLHSEFADFRRQEDERMELLLNCHAGTIANLEATIAMRTADVTDRDSQIDIYKEKIDNLTREAESFTRIKSELSVALTMTEKKLQAANGLVERKQASLESMLCELTKEQSNNTAKEQKIRQLEGACRQGAVEAQNCQLTIASQASRITDLQAELDIVNAELATATEQWTECRETIDGQGRELSSLQAAITSTQSQREHLQGELVQQQDLVRAMEVELATEKKALREELSVKSLQWQEQQLDLQQRLTMSLSELEGQKNYICEMEEALERMKGRVTEKQREVEKISMDLHGLTVSSAQATGYWQFEKDELCASIAAEKRTVIEKEQRIQLLGEELGRYKKRLNQVLEEGSAQEVFQLHEALASTETFPEGQRLELLGGKRVMANPVVMDPSLDLVDGVPLQDGALEKDVTFEDDSASSQSHSDTSRSDQAGMLAEEETIDSAEEEARTVLLSAAFERWKESWQCRKNQRIKLRNLHMRRFRGLLQAHFHAWSIYTRAQEGNAVERQLVRTVLQKRCFEPWKRLTKSPIPLLKVEMGSFIAADASEASQLRQYLRIQDTIAIHGRELHFLYRTYCATTSGLSLIITSGFSLCLAAYRKLCRECFEGARHITMELCDSVFAWTSSRKVAPTTLQYLQGRTLLTGSEGEFSTERVGILQYAEFVEVMIRLAAVEYEVTEGFENLCEAVDHFAAAFLHPLIAKFDIFVELGVSHDISPFTTTTPTRRKERALQKLFEDCRSKDSKELQEGLSLARLERMLMKLKLIDSTLTRARILSIYIEVTSIGINAYSNCITYGQFQLFVALVAALKTKNDASNIEERISRFVDEKFLAGSM
jgi:hypothetical protein